MITTTTRRRRAAAIALGLLAVAAPLVGAKPAAAAPVNVTGGTITWGVKASFRTYIAGAAAGTVTPSGGAVQAASNGVFTFPVASGSQDTATSDTTATSTGAVAFLGHEGVLDVKLSDIRLAVAGTTGTIVVDAVSRPFTNPAVPAAPVTYDDVVFATVDLTGITPTTGTNALSITDAPVKLAATGVPVMAGFYPVNTALDPISAALTLEAPTPPAPTDKLTWQISEQTWTSSSLSPLHEATAPATKDATNGWVFPAGASTYDPATGAASASFQGAIQLGNTAQGGYRIKFANPTFTVDADGAGKLVADPSYCASAALCTAGTWVTGDDITILSFDVQDDNGVVTDAGNRYTLTLTGPWASKGYQFDAGLIGFLPTSLQGHFKATGADPLTVTNAKKAPAPFTITFAHTPPPPVGVSDSVDITTTVEPGALAISIADDAVVLPTPALNSAGTWLTTAGALPAVTVTDTRATDPGWNVSAQLTDFGGPTGFSGTNLGWTPSVGTITPGQNVTAGGVVAPGTGVSGATFASATAGHGLGTAILGAALSLRVPTNTSPGTYTATLTLTAI